MTTIIHYSFFIIHFFRSPLDPVPEARSAQSYRFIRTNQIRTDYPVNNTALPIAAARKYMGNTAGRPPDGLAPHLLALFPSSSAEIP